MVDSDIYEAELVATLSYKPGVSPIFYLGLSLSARHKNVKA